MIRTLPLACTVGTPRLGTVVFTRQRAFTAIRFIIPRRRCTTWAKDEVVWTGTIRMIDPENVDQAIENYVQSVVAALKEKNVLRG